MAKKKTDTPDVLTPEQRAAEQRRAEEDSRREFERATWDNFARNVALGVVSYLAHNQTGRQAGEWAADFVKSFRDGLSNATSPPDSPEKVSEQAEPGNDTV